MSGEALSPPAAASSACRQLVYAFIASKYLLTAAVIFCRSPSDTFLFGTCTNGGLVHAKPVEARPQSSAATNNLLGVIVSSVSLAAIFPQSSMPNQSFRARSKISAFERTLGDTSKTVAVVVGEQGPNHVQRFGGYEDELVKTRDGWRFKKRIHVRNKAWSHPLLQSEDLN
jgi:hypothetical protein